MFYKVLGSRAGFSAVCSRHSAIASASAARAMPLRAKMAGQVAAYSSQYDHNVRRQFNTFPEDEDEDVVFNSIYGLRTIELNRPSKLNSLNDSMVRKILPRMIEWEKSDMSNVVVIKGAGRAFCAGGDVTELAMGIKADRVAGAKKASRFFAHEYQLDHYIATYQKPLVAFMDGVTMGGGVGLSVHSPLRIATERTLFAMPETKIGLFPDVGASFFLPRLNGAIGTYLALTSERLGGANVYYSGIATHYMDSTLLGALEARLAELRFKDYDSLATRLASISRTIDEFATGLPHEDPVMTGELRAAIDRCFGKNSMADILRALEDETGATRDWAQSTLQSLHERSPTSVYVALRQMRISKDWTIAETFQREHAMATKFMGGHDFVEGVETLLINKDPSARAPWQPATLAELAAAEGDVTAEYFLTPEDKMPLLVKRDYAEYPHAKLGVPTEKEVRELVESTELSPAGVVDALVRSRNKRQGIKAVVGEIVERCVQADEHGRAQWVQATPVVQEPVVQEPVVQEPVTAAPEAPAEAPAETPAAEPVDKPTA